MNIRPMTIEDYDAVYQLWSDTEGIGMRTLDDSLSGINKFLIRNPHTNFVAVDYQQLIGVILCGHDGRRGYIYHTAVRSDSRKKGIGRTLVDTALHALQNEQINKVALVVYSTNELGNQFWEKIGFQKREDLFYLNFSINKDNF